MNVVQKVCGRLHVGEHGTLSLCKEHREKGTQFGQEKSGNEEVLAKPEAVFVGSVGDVDSVVLDGKRKAGAMRELFRDRRKRFGRAIRKGDGRLSARREKVTVNQRAKLQLGKRLARRFGEGQTDRAFLQRERKRNVRVDCRKRARKICVVAVFAQFFLRGCGDLVEMSVNAIQRFVIP